MKKILLFIVMIQCALTICAQDDITSKIEHFKSVYAGYDANVKKEMQKKDKDRDEKLIYTYQSKAIELRDSLIAELTKAVELYELQIRIPDFFAISDSTIFYNMTLEEHDMVAKLNDKEKADYEKIKAIRGVMAHIDSIQANVDEQLKKIATKEYTSQVVFEIVRAEVKNDIYSAKAELRSVLEMLQDPQTKKIETKESGFLSQKQYEYLKSYESKFDGLYKKWILNQ